MTGHTRLYSPVRRTAPRQRSRPTEIQTRGGGELKRAQWRARYSLTHFIANVPRVIGRASACVRYSLLAQTDIRNRVRTPGRIPAGPSQNEKLRSRSPASSDREPAARRRSKLRDTPGPSQAAVSPSSSTDRPPDSAPGASPNSLNLLAPELAPFPGEAGPRVGAMECPAAHPRFSVQATLFLFVCLFCLKVALFLFLTK